MTRTRQRGASVISSTLGVVMAMTFLLVGVHVVLALHTRTVVRAAAWEAARTVARDPAQATDLGDARLSALIGGLQPERRWSTGAGGWVRLAVRVRRPSLAPFGVLDGLTTTSIVVQVREERWR